MDARVPYPKGNNGVYDDKDHRIPLLKRSLSMAEAMCQTQNLERPIPVLPKVRKEGKEFLKHNQTCQWIKFMQNPNPSPPSSTPRPPPTVPNIATKITQKTTGLDILPEPNHQPKESYYEDQLKVIMKKQEDLSERQQRLEEELRQQKEWNDQHMEQIQNKSYQTLQSLPAEDWVSTTETQHSGVNGVTPTFRRRLKGNVAQFCAQRNEGCLDNILYYGDRPSRLKDTQFPRSRMPSCSDMDSNCENTTVRHESVQSASPQRSGANIKGLSPASVGRRHAMAQESGHAVSQLITNTNIPPSGRFCGNY